MLSENSALLKKMIEPTIQALGYELWGYVFIPQGGRSLLRIYIDSQQGITVTDCERVSRQLSALLDVEGPVRGSYNLEVSSPGFNRGLFRPEQYQRYIGHLVELQTRSPLEKRRNFKGRITLVTDAGVAIEDLVINKLCMLPWDNIARAHLLPEKTK